MVCVLINVKPLTKQWLITLPIHLHKSSNVCRDLALNQSNFQLFVLSQIRYRYSVVVVCSCGHKCFSFRFLYRLHCWFSRLNGFTLVICRALYSLLCGVNQGSVLKAVLWRIKVLFYKFRLELRVVSLALIPLLISILISMETSRSRQNTTNLLRKTLQIFSEKHYKSSQKNIKEPSKHYKSSQKNTQVNY